MSGPACPSPPSSSSTNLFSSYSSTSTFRNRADDTVFFDIPDPDRWQKPLVGAASTSCP
ncbi:actin-related protein 2/3 complex subunit 5 [Prionailurus iriomotensis]